MLNAFATLLPLTAEERGACEVAEDLAQCGRPDEALALLKREAPHRLRHACQVCGSAPGSQCRELDGDLGPRIAPHMTRVLVGT